MHDLTPRIGAVALGLLLALAGCRGSAWFKAGTDEMDFGEADGACIVGAYAKLPPATARTPVFGMLYDANAAARDAAVTECLTAKGWTKVAADP